jgi:hypothetical protein
MQLPPRIAYRLLVAFVFLASCHASIAATMAPTSRDADILNRSKLIVAGRLSDNVHHGGDDRPYADIKDVRPLFVDRMPSDDGGWPKELSLRLTDTDAFKPGQDGVWLLEWTEHGWQAPGPQRFRVADEKQAFLESLESWLDAQIRKQTDAAVAAIAKDPQVEHEATWQTVRQLTILLENEIRSPLFDAKQNENPARTHIRDLFARLGLDLPVAPNPQTPQELKRAAEILKPMMYYNRTFDHPGDPGFRVLVDQGMKSYWRMQLDRINDTLAANPTEFAGEVEMLKHLATPESMQRQFPVGVAVTRMGMFLGRAGDLARIREP